MSADPAFPPRSFSSPSVVLASALEVVRRAGLVELPEFAITLLQVDTEEPQQQGDWNHDENEQDVSMHQSRVGDHRLQRMPDRPVMPPSGCESGYQPR
jgi:hypothetical protein